MAEYMIVDDARHLVPLGGLDPIQTAPLTDAGLTPYHAIQNASAQLVAGSTAVVIGSGGLGHVGIQLLKALSGARVVALDVNDDKLQFARSVGADEAFLSNEDAISDVMDFTRGRGAEVIFDFVGAPPTTSLAPQLVATEAL
jgi:propanol-preferring alcohol dehydrogenase